VELAFGPVDYTMHPPPDSPVRVPESDLELPVPVEHHYAVAGPFIVVSSC
jgi:hypothetical protein